MQDKRNEKLKRDEYYLETFIDKFFLEQLGENPPDGLHEVEVHGFVIFLKVDPPSGARDDGLPLRDVARDDGAALLVVLVDSELEDVLALFDAKLLVDLVLDGEAVAIPAEAARDVMAGHGLVARDDVLDCAGEDVTVVREAGGEGRAIVEDVLRLVLRQR